MGSAERAPGDDTGLPSSEEGVRRLSVEFNGLEELLNRDDMSAAAKLPDLSQLSFDTVYGRLLAAKVLTLFRAGEETLSSSTGIQGAF